MAKNNSTEQNNKIYPYSKRVKIFFTILSLVFILFFIVLSTIAFFDPETENKIFISIAPFFVSVFFIFCLLGIYKSRYELDDKSITAKGIIKQETLVFNDIKGYIPAGTTYFLIPKNKKVKKFGIITYVENSNELIAWVAENFQDLNAKAREEAEEIILTNKKFGETNYHREQKLKIAKRFTFIFNTIAFILAILGFFYPHPYKFIITLLIIFPLFAILLPLITKGLIRFTTGVIGANPLTFPAYLGASSALLIRAILDSRLVEFTATIIPFLFVSLIIFALIFIYEKNYSKKLIDILIIFPFAMFYGYGLTDQTNYLLDKSEPQLFEAIILEKEENKYFSYVKVTEWGPITTENEIKIIKSKFDTIQKGDTITIVVKKGALKIPWYYVQGE